MSVGASVPALIPDLDDGQFIPFGDSDQFKVGVRNSDGNLVFQTANGDFVFDENLNATIPGSLDQDPVELGANADASGTDATAVGAGASATNTNTSAFGDNASATGGDATALGREAQAPAQWNTVVGYDAGGSNNGQNVVIIGRKATATGDNTVAVGELAQADANNATAVGRDTDATGTDASAFGQGASVSGNQATAVGQGLSVSNDDATAVGVGITISGTSATAVGRNAEASANNATAIGDGATASASGAVAIGQGVTVSQTSTFGFGSRDLEIADGNTIVYPDGVGQQVIANKIADGTQTSGTAIGYQFQIDGTVIAEIYAESDGSGGIQNARLDVPVDLSVSGTTTEVDNVVTGDVLIEDGGGTEQFRFDATVSPIVADFHNNRVSNFGLKDAETLTYPAGVGTQTLVDKVQDGTQSAGTGVGYGFAVDGTTFFEVEAESDGAGGIQNQRVTAGAPLELAADGREIRFGAGPDMSTRYDAGADDQRWQDEVNDADRMALDRTTGDLTITGTLTEGAAL